MIDSNHLHVSHPIETTNPSNNAQQIKNEFGQNIIIFSQKKFANTMRVYFHFAPLHFKFLTLLLTFGLSWLILEMQVKLQFGPFA